MPIHSNYPVITHNDLYERTNDCEPLTFDLASSDFFTFPASCFWIINGLKHGEPLYKYVIARAPCSKDFDHDAVVYPTETVAALLVKDLKDEIVKLLIISIDLAERLYAAYYDEEEYPYFTISQQSKPYPVAKIAIHYRQMYKEPDLLSFGHSEINLNKFLNRHVKRLSVSAYKKIFTEHQADALLCNQETEFRTH